MTRKWQFVLIFSMLSIVGVGAVYYFSRLDDHGCVGLTEEELIARFGNPSSRFPGNFGAPPIYLFEGRESIETLCWTRLSGTLFVSTSRENGRRVCFNAAWLMRGAVF